MIDVYGDYMTDRWYIAGGVRNSPEADCPIYNITETAVYPGGAGNVYTALKALGETVNKCFYPNGPVKTRIIVDGIQVCRIDTADYATPWPFTPSNPVVVISDYNKGSIVNSQLADYKHTYTTIWVNSKAPAVNLACLDGDHNTHWVCNSTEYISDLSFYAKQPSVYVTSVGGITRYVYGRGVTTRLAVTREVVSVAGAGDWAFAGLISAPHEVDRMAWAMVCAGLKCEMPYTQGPELVDVWERYNELYAD